MKLITIGCSFTEGQELKMHQSECYTHKLAEKIKIEYYNFGVCGASNDYIFRKIFELIESNIITKEDIILIQWTHYNRKELPFTFDKKKFYYYPPNTLSPMVDKKIHDETKSTQSEYYNINLDDNFYQLKDVHTDLLNNYTFNFLKNEYQQNTTKNYINSLYTYFEHFGYKHLHFFGWKECIIDGVNENKFKFLKETFGTSIHVNGLKLFRHPNKEEHLDWANFLYTKIQEINYI